MATFTTGDGVRLNYTDEGDGTPVVLIAGFAAPLETWERQRPAPRAEGYRVTGLDRRSHGGSDKSAYGQRLSRHGQDLADFLDALGLDDVVLVGGSMGASTVWAYGDLVDFDRVRGVVSVDQTPKMVNDETWSYGFYGLDRQNLGTFFADGIPATGRGLAADRMAGIGRVVAALGGRVPSFADPRAVETRPGEPVLALGARGGHGRFERAGPSGRPGRVRARRQHRPARPGERRDPGFPVMTACTERQPGRRADGGAGEGQKGMTKEGSA